METTQEKVSYCIGFETGKNLVRQFAEIDIEALLLGMQNAVRDEAPKLPQEEIGTLLQNLRQQVEGQRKQFLANLSEKNKKEGEEFLAKNKVKEGVTTLNSGLQYKILQKGTGQKPTLLDTVSVHYRGSFINGQIFDSSYERGKPQQFPVNRVIPGWSEALQLMHVGDKLEIAIPHYLAYGDHGFGQEIGPSTTLLFEMELLEIH